MKIKINRTTIELFDGATVRHAIMKYLKHRRISQSFAEKAVILDSYGHLTDLDAPLKNGQSIKCKI